APLPRATRVVQGAAPLHPGRHAAAHAARENPETSATGERVKKIVIAFLIALVPLAAFADKRAKIHTMLSIVGADVRDDSSEFAAFDSQMDEIQVDAAIAFFTSDAGRQF